VWTANYVAAQLGPRGPEVAHRGDFPMEVGACDVVTERECVTWTIWLIVA